MLRAINRGRRPDADAFGLFDDGWYNLRFRMDTYYTLPRYQIGQLREAGFDDIRTFSLEDGQELGQYMDDSKEPWIYYLCTRP